MAQEFHILSNPAPKDCPFLEGDRGKAWIACCSRRFLPIAKQIVGEDDLVQDVLQESWLKSLQAAPKTHFVGPKACSWMHRIIANAAKDARKERLRRREVRFRDRRDPNEPARSPRLSEVKDPEPSPEVLACQRELLVRVRKAMKALPAPCRQVVELRVYQGFSNKETSELLHISRSNASTLLNRALNILKCRLHDLAQPSPSRRSKAAGQT